MQGVVRRPKVVATIRRYHLWAVAVGAIGAFFMFAPVVWMVLSSLKPNVEILALPLQLFPKQWTVGGYVAVWQESGLARAYLNSLIVCAATVTSVLFTSSLGGYVFSRLRFPGRRLVFYFALSTIMVPFITLFVPLYVVFARLGLADSYVGLWLPSAISSIGIFLCRQFMYSIPTELYDAAKIDGAGEWTVYWRIVLPLIKPALAVVGIFTFLGAFNNYLWPLVLINNQSLYTLPLVLANNINGLGITNYQLLMAGAVLASVPTVIVFLLFQRYIMRGIALTGGNY